MNRPPDANLIAASPDLYAVCKEIREAFSYFSEWDLPIGFEDRLNQALAKAKWLESLEKPWEKFKDFRPAINEQFYGLSKTNGVYGCKLWTYECWEFQLDAVVHNRAFPYTEEGRAAAEARLKNLQEAK